MRIVQIITACALLLLINSAIAGPAAPDSIEIAQPDGTTFKAYMHGDEHQNWVEALESGHTVVRNKESGYWEYAEKNQDGTLKSSGIKVDPTGKSAPLFIPKGIKPDRKIK